jgi:hypothetical protein
MQFSYNKKLQIFAIVMASGTAAIDHGKDALIPIFFVRLLCPPQNRTLRQALQKG